MSRIAIVTGGVSGIGAATAKLLTASGYDVIASFFGNDCDADMFHGQTAIPAMRATSPVLVRFNAGVKTDFPRHRDDIIFVPSPRTGSTWENVPDNGPSQQAAIAAADAIIRQQGVIQTNVR